MLARTDNAAAPLGEQWHKSVRAATEITRTQNYAWVRNYQHDRAAS